MFSRALKRGYKAVRITQDAHACQGLAGLRGGVDTVRASYRNRAGTVLQHAQRGGLACAIGAQQAGDAAIGRVQVNALHRLHKLGRLAPKWRRGWPPGTLCEYPGCRSWGVPLAVWGWTGMNGRAGAHRWALRILRQRQASVAAVMKRATTSRMQPNCMTP